MKTMKKYILLIFFAAALGSAVNAQQALTMYNMDRVMQTQFVNPSADIPYKIHIGGLLVPIAGQIPPPMYFNYANNSFKWNHIYHPSGIENDTSYVLDIPLFMDKLQKTTHMRFETNFELINVGIKLENMFLTVALTEKMRYGLSLPYDLFEFTLNGNMPYMEQDKPLDFSGLGANFTHYRELAVGVSMIANDKITVGGRIKLLFGQANFNTNIDELSLYTDPDDYSMTWTTDMKIQSSLPIYYDYMVHNVENGIDSISFDLNEESLDMFKDNPLSYPFNFKNLGIGFDLGVTYKLTPEIDLYASLLDFGFISWNTNPQNLVSKGQYDYRGLQVEMWEDNDEMQESLDNMVDTILNTFKFDLLESGYVTWLPSSIYLGGKYKFHEKLHFTGLYRGEFYRKSYFQSFTLGVNSNLTNWLSAHVTYSLAHRTADNIGVGFSARLGPVNWYMVTDGLTQLIFPQSARNLNIRMGCNIVFGYKKIKSSASMRT